MLTMEKFEELRELVWQTHVEKGFAAINNKETNDRFFMQIVGEIAEAYEEYRKGRITPYIDSKGKPQGEVVELADIAIRAFNRITFCKINTELYIVLYKYAYDLFEGYSVSSNRELTYRSLINSNNSTICDIDFNSDNATINLIAKIDAFVSALGYDLEQLIRDKNAYNLTREYLHGKQF